MAVKLKERHFQDGDLNTFKSDVSSAVNALSNADVPTVRVVQSNGNVILTGDEDYVLIDMSSAIKDVYVLLPSPNSLERAVTVKVTAKGKPALYVKGSDTGSVLINGQAQVKVDDSVKVIATPTQFYTV